MLMIELMYIIVNLILLNSDNNLTHVSQESISELTSIGSSWSSHQLKSPSLKRMIG